MFDKTRIADFHYCKDFLLATVVSPSKVKSFYDKFGENLAYKEEGDLCIIYRILAGMYERGGGFIEITDRILTIWNVKAKDLHDIAMHNTKKFLPIAIYPMEARMMLSMLFGLDTNMEDHSSQPLSGLTIVTSKQAAFGAIYMFDPDALLMVAKRYHTDRLCIIPSSAHEIIVTDANTLEQEMVNQLIKNVNEECTNTEERLSDHAYIFHADLKQLTPYIDCSQFV